MAQVATARDRARNPQRTREPFEDTGPGYTLHRVRHGCNQPAPRPHPGAGGLGRPGRFRLQEHGLPQRSRDQKKTMKETQTPESGNLGCQTCRLRTDSAVAFGRSRAGAALWRAAEAEAQELAPAFATPGSLESAGKPAHSKRSAQFARPRPICALLLLLMLIAGCAVGPNFKRPDAPKVSGYIPSPLTNTETITNVVGGEQQHFVQGKDISGEWWKLFHSPPLNELITRAFKANPDLKAAQAAVVAARENVYAQRGAYYPSLS